MTQATSSGFYVVAAKPLQLLFFKIDPTKPHNETQSRKP